MPKKFLLAGMFLMLCAGCGATGGAPHGTRFQSFEYGNDGVGTITNIEIHYGGLLLPSSDSARESMHPPGFHIAPFAESQDAVIPENAVAFWTSADSKRHTATLPIRALIPDLRGFSGFEFFFVDDHLDVYLKSLGPAGAKYQEVRSTKVYSTTP
jgi:hypothetical protein